jgi:hypothetical protein
MVVCLSVRSQCHEEGHMSDTSDASDVGGVSQQVMCIGGIGAPSITG